MDSLLGRLCANGDTGVFGGTPWEKKVPVVVGLSDFPKQVILHISNMVYVSKSGFQESDLALLKRLCAFVNPQYKIAQNSRRSTYGIPRIIDCGYEDDRFIGMPRGYLEKVEALFERYGVPYEVEDERCCGKHISVSFTGTLRPLQEEAVEALLREETGILEAEPSFGKTVTALGLIARRGVNTLVIVHTGALLNQWRKSIEQFLGVKAGQVGQQKNKRTNIIDVAIFASLVEGDENGDKRVKPMVSEYGMVIVDECHHTSARTYEMVLREVRAKYVYGLSATPISFMQCGPVRYKHRLETELMERSCIPLLFPRFTGFRAQEELELPLLFNHIGEDAYRNRQIVEDAKSLMQEGRNVIILTQRTGHAEYFAKVLENEVDHMFLLVGNEKAREKREKLERLRCVSDTDSFAISATGRYVGEGFDVPRLDTLLLVMPIAGEEMVKQYLGRIIREYKGKSEIRMYDYVDVHVPRLEAMYRKRLRVYKKLGLFIQYVDVMDRISRQYEQDEYFEDFFTDMAQIASSIVIRIESVREVYLEKFVALLLEAKNRGVSCSVKVMDKHFEQLLREQDIETEQGTINRFFVVLDKEIIWYGGSAFLNTGKEAVRIESADIAGEFLKDDRSAEESMYISCGTLF